MCYLSAVMMRIPLLRLGLFVVLMVGVAAVVFSQTDQSAGPTERDDPRMVIARGLSEYPVTVGDQYRVFL